jgi:hypothetical protein
MGSSEWGVSYCFFLGLEPQMASFGKIALQSPSTRL